MKILLLPFLALSAIGFGLSLIAHVYSLFGLLPPGGDSVMDLHMGIFVVWLPAVLVAQRMARGTNRKDFWKVVSSNCPAWMLMALKIAFAYAIVNFAFFIFDTSHLATTAGTTPTVVRGFSGHWMVFYGAAFVILYSAMRSPPSRL